MKTLYLLPFVCCLFAIAAFAQPEEKFMSADNLPETALSGKAQKALQTLRKNPLFERVQVVKMGTMAKVQKNGKFALSVPGKSGQYEVRMTSVRAQSEMDYVWMGELADSLGSITLISEKGRIRGHFALGEEQYEIFPLEDGDHALVKLDVKKLSGRNCTESGKLDKAPKPKGAGGRQEACVSQGDQVVRILILFTNRALAADPNILQTCQLAMAQLNQAFQNSQFGHRTAVVAAIRQFDLPTENETDPIVNLNTFRNFSINERMRSQADLAVLITGNYNGNSDGVAFSDLQANNSIFADAVVAVGSATSTFVFTHEVGHLLGGDHQNCSNLITANCSNTSTYNHGYAFTTGGTYVRFEPLPVWYIEPVRPRSTVMTAVTNPPFLDFSVWRDSDTYSRILGFSNPNVRIGNRQTETGTQDLNNNARWIDERFLNVANYDRSSILSNRIEGPSTLNPYTTYTWEAVYRCGMGPYTFQWELSTNGFNYSTIGNGEILTSGAGFLFSGNPSFLRLTVRSADGQASVAFLTLNRSSGGRVGTEEVAAEPVLHEAHPNPVTGETTISYTLAYKASVKLDLIDHTGRTIATLIDRMEESGTHSQTVDCRNWSMGVYLYRLQVNGKMETKRLLVAH